jgi:hypothetical protein
MSYATPKQRVVWAVVGAARHIFSRSQHSDFNVQIIKLEKAVLEEVIDEAHRQGLKATVHTVDEEAVIEALEAGADGLEHGVVEHKLKDDRVVGANSKGEPKATADAISEQLKIQIPVAAMEKDSWLMPNLQNNNSGLFGGDSREFQLRLRNGTAADGSSRAVQIVT